MKRKAAKLLLMLTIAAVFTGGCKKNVGTPEDNAVVELSLIHNLTLPTILRV